MTITIVGHGYVGLVTACLFADLGMQVYVIGRNAKKIEKLKKGDPLIYEPGLQELLNKGVEAKRLFFTTSYTDAIPKSEVVFIAVGTPQKNDGTAELSAVFETAKKIGKALKNGYTVVACKSTVPVGTNRKISNTIESAKKGGAEFNVASCPEFLREGTAIQDTFSPDRVVIGTDSQKATTLLSKLHEPLKGKKIVVGLESAELIKYASNAMLATKISFANLISFICENSNADISEVLLGVGLDRRIGKVYMNPGIGYGGSCLPKDVVAMIKIGRALDVDMLLLKAVDEINKRARDKFVEKVSQVAPAKTLGVWGLSFKPNTDDIREAPSVYVIKSLLEKDYRIKAYDPAAIDNIRKVFGKKITYCKDPLHAAKKASALLVLTEWNEFKRINLKEIKQVMKHPVVIDGRGIYQPGHMLELGFKYFVIGKNI